MRADSVIDVPEVTEDFGLGIDLTYPGDPGAVIHKRQRPTLSHRES